MATQNVKILLRRGLRDEMTTETLHTGEMGFTTDTNQLYIGTDDAINEIQFEPFANAHAIIQSWLDSYQLDANGVNIGDCPYPGLDVDEDLIIRLYNGEDVDVILEAMRYFEQEVTLSTDAITFSNGDVLYQYFDDAGTVRQRSEGIITGSVDNGDGTTTLTLKVGEREEYNFRGERVIATNVIAETINSTTDGVNQLKVYINAQGPNPLYVTAGQLDELFDVTTIEVNNGVDAAYNLTLADADYTVQYMDNTSNEEDTHFLITFANPVQDGKQTQVDIVNTDTHTAPHTTNSFPLIENYQTTTPVVEVNSVVQVLGTDYNIVNDNIVFITIPTDDITIRYEVDVLVNTDEQVSFTVTFDDSDNFWFSMDKNLTSLDTAIKASNITGVREFQPALYGRARRNVEVITENSFNQQFADQHLTSLDVSTGLRSSLNRKALSGVEGTFLKYNKMICTTFFIDYSLVQKDGVNTFLRAGQLKVINTSPMNTTTNPVLEQTKLSDDNTEVWQDTLGNTSDVAENIEFSNINFYAEIVGEHLHIKYTQLENFETEISYTVKRWSM